MLDLIKERCYSIHVPHKCLHNLSNFWLARIAVHGDEVAGKAAEQVIICLSFRSGANGDHFDASIKMVFNDLSIFPAGNHRLLNSRLQFTNIANAKAYSRRYYHEYTGKSENLSRPNVVGQQACQDKPPG